MKQFRLLCCHVMAAITLTILLASCEKSITTDSTANCRLTFSVTNSDAPAPSGSAAGNTTRATVSIGDYFTKLNIMLFDSLGNRAFDKVKTQMATDDDFGQLACQLVEGTYTVVAVGHSSIKSATIKSPDMVQFTASDGEKLTDTFVYCGQVTVSDASASANNFNLTMHRATAMVQIEPVDVYVPQQFTRLIIGYTGGSANVNPTTLLGTTKSTQSEARAAVMPQLYQVFTFPYMADSCLLKMTLTAYDADGNTLKQRTLNDVPVTRNRITRCYGTLLDDGGVWQYQQATFGFTVNPDWDGVNEYMF